MASGDHLFTLLPDASHPTGTLYATRDWIEDGATPSSLIPVLDFDTGNAEHAEWKVPLPAHYGGGAFTWRWKGGTDLADTGTFILALRIKPIADATILTGDLLVDNQTADTITDTPPATPINKLNYSIDGELSAANAGSPSAGDYVIIRASRDISDTNTGDLQLAAIEIEES